VRRRFAPVSAIVRLPMLPRVAIVISTIALLLWSTPAAAISCIAPRNLPAWVEHFTSEAADIFLARIRRVSKDPAGPHGVSESATVEIKVRLKGSTTRNTVDTDYFTNFRLKHGEERVFFLDSRGVIVGCSDYKHFVSEKRLMEEIRIVLGRKAT